MSLRKSLALGFGISALVVVITFGTSRMWDRAAADIGCIEAFVPVTITGL